MAKKTESKEKWVIGYIGTVPRKKGWEVSIQVRSDGDNPYEDWYGYGDTWLEAMRAALKEALERGSLPREEWAGFVEDALPKCSYCPTGGA